MRNRASGMPALIAIVGPDEAASGLLYALVAHLASYAQLDETAPGAFIPGAIQDELPLVLAGRTTLTDRWRTYRLCFGPAGEEQVRLMHLVLDEDGPFDEMARYVLADADQIWLVLPRRSDAAAADTYVEGIRAHGGSAVVRLVVDRQDRGRGSAFFAPARAVECGWRIWPMDLERLRRRYLAGGVSPREARRLVERILDPDGGAPEVGADEERAEREGSFPTFAVRPGARAITLDDVKRLEDEV